MPESEPGHVWCVYCGAEDGEECTCDPDGIEDDETVEED